MSNLKIKNTTKGIKVIKSNTQKTACIDLDVLSWSGHTVKILPSARPHNVLDKKPDEHDRKSLIDLVTDFMGDSLSKVAAKTNKKNGKNFTGLYGQLAKYLEIPLRELFSALAVQRPISKRRLKKIMETFNPLKVQYVNVLKIKFEGIYYYYIIDGQHTAVCYGIAAQWGWFSPDLDPDDWANVNVRCQVVEYHNFTFAREHFLGINGDDKLKLAAFDKWQNYVLAKRQDSPTDVTLEKYEDAYNQQCIMESYGIIPIHERNEDDADKPGAFVRVDLLKDVTEEELHWICRVHQLNFDNLNVDAFEVKPMINLRNKIKGSKSLENTDVCDFIIALGNIIKNTVVTPAKFQLLATEAYRRWYETAYPGDKTPSIPDDLSLVLLLFMYYEAGGTFNRISKTFMDDYDNEGYTVFHGLDSDLQAMIRKE